MSRHVSFSIAGVTTCFQPLQYLHLLHMKFLPASPPSSSSSSSSSLHCTWSSSMLRPSTGGFRLTGASSHLLCPQHPSRQPYPLTNTSPPHPTHHHPHPVTP